MPNIEQKIELTLPKGIEEINRFVLPNRNIRINLKQEPLYLTKEQMKEWNFLGCEEGKGTLS